MPNPRYEPVPTTDLNDNLSLKNLQSSNDTPSYFSGTPTSAPPSFHSRTNSFSEVEQPVPFGAVIPGSVNTTNSTGTAWTSSSTTMPNEMISILLARIERLETDSKAKINQDGSVDEWAGDVEDMVRRKRKDRCCTENLVVKIFGFLCMSLVIIWMGILGIVWINAWGKRGRTNCGITAS